MIKTRALASAIIASAIFFFAADGRAQTACTTLPLNQLLASFADTAPAGSITPHTIRNFVCSTALVDGSGNLAVTGTLSAPTANISGAVTAATGALSGALTAGSATLSGALTSATVNASGSISGASASLTGALAAGSLSLTGFTVDSSGNATANSVITAALTSPTTGIISMGNATHGTGMVLADSGGTTLNQLVITPAATGVAVQLLAGGTGSDTNVSMKLETKGTGSLLFLTNTSVQQFQVTNTASAVDFITVTGGVTGTPGSATLSVAGTDSNASLILNAKGTGAIQLGAGGGTQMQVTNTASAVDFLSATGGVTGTPGSATLSVAGSDSNVTLVLSSKGTAAVQVGTGGGTQLQVTNTASAVDFFTVTGGATGSPGAVTLSAAGSDTDVNMILAPKGAGVIKLGNAASFTANNTTATTMTSLGPTGAHTTIQEWLTVQDSAGTVRYIPAY